MHSRLLCVALICSLASPAYAEALTQQHELPDTHLALRIGGLAGFAAFYLGSVLNAVLTGAFDTFGGFASSSQNGLFIPLAGPWVTALHPSNRNVGSVTLLAFDGLAQLAGAGMFVLSFVLPRPQGTRSAWQLVPGPGSLSLNVRWP